MYAYSPDQTTIVQRYAELPAMHWVQDAVDPPTGHYEPLTVANAASLGYYPIDETATEPDDTATTTWDYSLPFVVDRFVVTWTERPKTQAELDADTDQTERKAARDAVLDLRSFIDNPSPNGADVVANAKLQNRALIRLIRDQYGR